MSQEREPSLVTNAQDKNISKFISFKKTATMVPPKAGPDEGTTKSTVGSEKSRNNAGGASTEKKSGSTRVFKSTPLLLDIKNVFLSNRPMTHGGHSIIARGLYALQLEPWLLEYSPTNEIKVLSISQLKGEKSKVINTLTRHDGVLIVYS